ncbi:ABC-F family ATP-binding cassette domain-containing protein, partial [Streptomyces nanshensis]
PGDVVGLVGANGAGKSTLLRMLATAARPSAPGRPDAGDAVPVADGPGSAELPGGAGHFTGGSAAAYGAGPAPEAEEGSVSLTPPTATVGFLPQEPERRAGETVRAFLERRTGVAAAQAALDDSTRALEEGRPGADDAYALALERWLALGAADLEERAAEVTARVGLDVAGERPMTTLSGGQAARASLASLLLSRYDVFLLDEPTNDLDLDGLRTLETFVSGLRAATVLVSHDREFLARTVGSVLELDLAQQQVRHYGGGYESYLEERERARRHAREEYEEYARSHAQLEARARQQRGWMDKGVRNARRKMPDNDKNLRNARIEATEKQAAKARQTDRMIERLEADAVEEPRKEWQLRMEIAAAPRSGSVVATLRGAEVRRGDFRLGPVDLQIDWRDRVAVTGPNGSGKSTLLAALLGRCELAAGTASSGSGVVVGEVDQARRLFHGEETLLDAFRAAASLQPEEVRTLLAKFGLAARHVLRPAVTLSPGERTRAALALLQGRGVNLLVLDEPTNHLDLPAIEQLESALATYEGTLLLVTHDRRMLEAVHTTRHLEVEDGRVRERRGV